MRECDLRKNHKLIFLSSSYQLLSVLPLVQVTIQWLCGHQIKLFKRFKVNQPFALLDRSKTVICGNSEPGSWITIGRKWSKMQCYWKYRNFLWHPEKAYGVSFSSFTFLIVSDKPWISTKTKNLIRRRQEVFDHSKPPLWRFYRNNMNKVKQLITAACW